MQGLIAISDFSVTAFSSQERNDPKMLADVVIGKCIERKAPNGMPLGGPTGGGGAYTNEGRYAGEGACF